MILFDIVCRFGKFQLTYKCIFSLTRFLKRYFVGSPYFYDFDHQNLCSWFILSSFRLFLGMSHDYVVLGWDYPDVEYYIIIFVFLFHRTGFLPNSYSKSTYHTMLCVFKFLIKTRHDTFIISCFLFHPIFLYLLKLI